VKMFLGDEYIVPSNFVILSKKIATIDHMTPSILNYQGLLQTVLFMQGL
jgi:hypothetical protein